VKHYITTQIEKITVPSKFTEKIKKLGKKTPHNEVIREALGKENHTKNKKTQLLKETSVTCTTKHNIKFM